MSERAARLRRQGTTIQRIRLGEEPGAEGKRVWHRGERIDVTTDVDAQGHALWQELVFEDRLVRWDKQQGLKTGREFDTRRSSGKQGGKVLVDDAQPARDTVQDALCLLDEVRADRYLGHLAMRLAAFLAEHPPEDTSTVTNLAPIARPPAQQPNAGLFVRIRKIFGS